MKKNYLLLACLIFSLLTGYKGFGQSVTYNIVRGNLTGISNDCGNGNVYNDCTSPFGFSYTDNQLPCGAVVTSVNVTFTQGVNCATEGNQPYYFNGVNYGNFDAINNCDCNMFVTAAYTVACSGNGYSVGGTNTFQIAPNNCLGFYYLNNNGNGIYAQVTVTYTTGATGCNIGTESHPGTTAAANCSPTWAFAANCGPGATVAIPTADVLANTYYDFQVSSAGTLASPTGIYVAGNCQTSSNLYSSYVSNVAGVTIGTDRVCGEWSTATSSVLQYRYSAPSVSINTGTGAAATATVCAGATTSYTISTTNVNPSGSNPYAWTVFSTTGTANATITSAGTSSPNVTFTNSGSTAGTVVIRCTASNNNKCFATANTFTITVDGAFTATASGGTTTVCNGVSPGTFTATAAGGNGVYTYQWYNSGGLITGATASTYAPGALTSSNAYYAIVSTGCGNITTNSISVTVDGVLTATLAGGSTTICYNTSPGTFTAIGGGGTGTYTYQWYNSSGPISGSTASTYTAPSLTAGDAYHVIITSGACGSATSATTTITVRSQFTATTTGGTSPICSGTSPGSFTTTAAGGAGSYTYQWYNSSGPITGATNSTYTAPTITANTQYYTSVTDASCGSITTTAIAITVQSPTVTGGPALSALCQGGTTPALGGSFGGTATGATWDDGGAGGSFTNNGGSTPNTTTYTTSATAPATVTLTLTTSGGPCGTASTSKTLTVNPNPTVTAGPALAAICQGGTTPALGGTFGGGASSATWTDGGVGGTFANNTGTTPGTTTYTAAANSPASVTLTLTTAGGSCGTNSVNKILTVNPNPVVSAGPGVAAICQSGTTAALGGSFSGGATAAVWTDGGAGGSFTNNSGTTPGTTTYTAASNAPASVTLTLTTSGGSCGTTSASIILTVNPNPTVNAGPGVAAICQGGTTTALGGSFGGGATSAIWDDGGAGGSFTNNSGNTPGTTTYTASTTAPASVTLTLTTFGGSCGSITDSRTLTVNPLPLVNAGPAVAAICQGGTTAALGGSFSGAATSAVWSDGGAGGTFTNNSGTTPNTTTYTASVSSGTTVTLTLTTAGGVCGNTSASKQLTINPNPVINSYTSTAVTCNGTNTGSITISASNGLPAYAYSIDSGVTPQSSNVFSNLPAGTDYVLEVSDSRGCYSFFASNPVTIMQPAALTQTDSSTTASCANVFDGSIAVTAAGGTTPYNYSLNGGPSQSGNTFSNLGAGTYVVEVGDANGCTDTAHVTITNSYIISDSLLNQTNVSCFGGTDGAFTVQLTGGVPAYSYSDNGSTFQSTPTFTGLSAGNYVITLRDSRGCTAFITTTVTQPSQLSVQIDSIQNILCSGQSQGAIFISVNGGTGPYTYTWSNSATTQDITNLTAGTYNVTVLDAKGCNSSSGATLTQPLPLFVNVATAHNLTCYRDSSGFIYINVSGGVPPYTYNWSNGATTQDITGVGANTYTVTVLDANACQATVTQTLTEPTQLTSTISATSVTCNGAANGSVTFTPSGGTTPYTYQWNNGATTQSLTNVNGGFYLVNLRDANGCTLTNSATVTEPAALVLTINSTNASCNGGGNATVTTTVTGGTGTITYLWSNGSTTANLTNVGAGPYSVVATDANSCTASASVTVSQPTALTLNGTVANVLCNGGNTGSVAVTVNGGTSPYAYSWSNGATTQNINGVPANTYTVNVTDANLCTISASFTVSQPAAITSSVAGTDVTCHGQANGTATLTVAGGTPGYTFNWSNFQATQNLTGLSGGTYYVIITDANGCTKRDSVIISEPAAIVLTINSTNVNCNGDTSGTVTTTVSGGTGTITYAWSNGATTANLTNLGAGTYSVVITDANSCTASASATISQPTALVLNGTVANVLCNGGSNGSVSVTVNGGVFPYAYSWSNGATTQNINGVPAGTYTIDATDANLCNISASFTVSQPTAITSSIAGTNVTCHGQANGTATLTVGGGTPGYTFNWSNFQATQNLTGLSGGTYYVIITDANGCTKRDSVIITEPAAIVLTVNSTNVSCNGGNNGSVTSTVSGGTGTITYLWNNGATTANLTNVVAGTYSLVITDANNCTAGASVTITQPAALVLNGTVANVLCAGGNNGSISITVNGGVFPYTYNWSNGATTQNVNNLPGGVTYTVTATDANLCSITASFNVTSPGAITTSITGTNVTCFDAKNGTASVTVTGGATPYTYLWSDFRGTPSIDSLSGGQYFVIVTDHNGCQVKDSIIISEPAQIVITSTVTQVTCNNASNGTISLSVTGGVPAYSYAWTPALTNSPNQTGLAGGNYVVTVSDTHSCSATAQISVTNPPAIAINYVVSNPRCYGDSNGSVNLIVSGGVPAYSFAWSNGETSEQLTGVPVGTYYVTVTDAGGCSVTDSANVASPTQLYTSGVIKNVSCFGAHDGQVLVSVYGGTLPYSYAWNTGASTGPIYNLSGGNYILTVTDANGCHVSSLYIVHEPTKLTLALSATNVSCFGGSNGSVTSLPSGGTSPYRYLWNNFNPDSLQSGLTAGLYSLQLTDSNSCYAFDSILVTQPTQINVTGFVNNALCFNSATGSIDVTATGGTPGYTYAWTSGGTDSTINTLNAGQYTVTVTDSRNCSVTSAYTVNQGAKVIIDLATYDPICNGGNTGAVTALVSGGVQPYQFLWSSSPNDTSVAVNHLTAGSYTVTVTDHVGCSTTADATLNQPASITLAPTVSGARCFNAATGVVIANTTGGNAPYNYSLNGIGQASDTFTHVLPGHYDLVTTDVNGCQGVDTFTILAPNTISVTLSVTDQVIVTGMQTQLSAAATSTSAILNYFWSPLVIDSAEVFDFSACPDSFNCSAPYVKPPFTQTFTVTVLNADSCTASDTVTVIVNASENPSFFPTAFTPNGDGLNDRFTFSVLGATTIDVTVFDRWGQKVYSNPAQPNGVSNSYGWDGTFASKNCPEDTYVYQLKITYFDGTTKNKAGTVTLMR